MAVAGSLTLGTSGPRARLDVQGSIAGAVAALGGSATQALYILNGRNLAGASEPALSTLTSSGSAAGDLAFGTGNTEAMRISVAGNIGIGIAPPATSKLAVNGKIAATEVLVTNAPGADFVFDPGYRLAPLSEVGAFVRENRHLPGVPSATEMAAKGSRIGEMQAKLLEKVEELTLHLIRADERITRLAEENRELRRVMARQGVR